MTPESKFDWKRRRQRARRQIFKEFLVLALPISVILYGLKMMVTGQGKMIVHIRTPGAFTMPVTGIAAVISGLADVGLGVFVILSCSEPLDERRPWIWRFAREIVRWGGATAAVVCTLKARQLAGLGSPWPQGPLTGQAKLIFLAALPFVVLLGFLGAIFWAMALTGRKAVKQELFARNLDPVHIRARPLSYWGQAKGLAFRVRYLDQQGFMHRAVCFASGRRLNQIAWFKDEIDVVDV